MDADRGRDGGQRSKSVADFAETTFFTDLTEFEAIVSGLQPLIDKVSRHSQDKGTRGRTVTLKVQFDDFELISRSRTVAGAIGGRGKLEFVTAELLRALFPVTKAVRLLAVSGFVVEEADSSAQIARDL